MDGHDTNLAVRNMFDYQVFVYQSQVRSFQNIGMITLAGKEMEKANSGTKFGDYAGPTNADDGAKAATP